jgi:hypothetical protein
VKEDVRTVANDRLRRHRLAEGWTEGQVAEQVRQRVEAATGRAAALDADYVSKLERGKITWPNRDYRTAFRDLFAVGADEELGFYCKRTRRDAATLATSGAAAPYASCEHGDDAEVAALEEVNPTDRRRLLGMAAAAAFGAPLREPVERIIAAADGARAPSRVGPGDVRDIAAMTAGFEEWDHRAGGGPTRRMALGGLHWAASLRTASTTPAVRAELNAAVAHLADLAAWTTFDVGLHSPARKLFLLGLSAAREADDRGVLVHVATGYARQELYIGNADGALELVRLAQASADQLTPTAMSMIDVVKAQAFARMPDAAACLRHIRRAEDHYTAATPAEDPPWIRYFTPAKLEGDIATALYDLTSTTGTVDATVTDRLGAAVARYPHTRARSRAIATARLATALYRQQAPARAATAGQQALDLAAGVRSTRLDDDLRAMAAAARRFPDDPTAKQLARRTRDALAAAV